MSLIRARVVSGKVTVRDEKGNRRTVRSNDGDPFVMVTQSFLKSAVNLMVAAPLPQEPVEKVKTDLPKPATQTAMDQQPEMRTAVPDNGGQVEPPVDEGASEGDGQKTSAAGTKTDGKVDSKDNAGKTKK